MNRAPEAIGVACAHCGLAVPPALVVREAGPSFCCAGCRTVHEVLLSHGLGQYYRLEERRETAVRSTGRSFEEFDHPAFHELYVRAESEGLSRVELHLEGVHCASCVWLLERMPMLLDGVARAELDLRRSLARIEWDPLAVPLSRVARLLDQLGYTPHPFRGIARDEVRRREDRRMLVRIGVAGAIAGNVMLVALALYAGEAQWMERPHVRLFRWVSLALTVPALLFPGRVFFTGALAALRTRTLHMDLPIALALGAATVRGAINTVTDSGPIYFDGVTLLIFLLLVGRFLQQRGQRVASDAAELLYSLAPGVARIRDPDGGEREVPSASLLPGMVALVRAGEVFPADGVVEEGSSEVNLALLTGESRPVSIAPGGAVHAGTQNLSAPVEFRVEAAGESSRLARILRQVEEGASRRAPIVLLADRMAGWFVAAVLLLAAATFLLWHGRSPELAWDHAIALLIVTCPCALALATPLAVTVAIGRAARSGIFIRGGDALERLARPGELVLDKTGTLTEGRTELVRWVGDNALRPMILGLESGSMHPVAEGFRRAWPGVVPIHTDHAHHQHGGGVIGEAGGHRVVIGAPAFVRRHATGVEGMLSRLGEDPLSPVVIAVDGRAIAIAGFGDRERVDASASLDALRARGWATWLLSGDDPRVAARTGARLGFEVGTAQGGVTPEAKLAFVDGRRARGAGRAVVMVGDGVNDAAAMAAADVGIGVHGGAEACLATADVHLTRAGLEPVVRLMDGASRTVRVIRRNIAWAIGYNLIGVGLAMTGTISPLVAAILMPASSLTVIGASWFGRTFLPAVPVVAAGEPVASSLPRMAA